MFIDPISDLISKIKNATKARLATTVIQTSNFTNAILTVLKNEGYIEKFEVKKNTKTNISKTIITIKYKNQIPAITGLKQISKPGLRIYRESKELPRVINGLGIALISTSQGVMTDKMARSKNIGGEVIAFVW